MRTLLIDNFDSFTYNLADLLWRTNGCRPAVVKNDTQLEAIDFDAFDNVVISPGPGHPGNARDFGICGAVIRNAALPILGVCLGHQGIAHVLGGKVARAPEPWHGRQSRILHNGEGIFEGLPASFFAVRYHSLIITELPSSLRATAHTSDGLVMGLAHLKRPIWGIQFHPESICTEHGEHLIANFRDLTRKRGRERRAFAMPAGVPHGTSSLDPVRPAAPQVMSRRIDAWVDPAVAYLQLFADAANSFWLDSSRLQEGEARFSFMGDDSGPLAECITHDVGTQTTTVLAKGADAQRIVGSFFDYLDKQLKDRGERVPHGLPFEFNLGYVGFLGYEMKAETGGQLAQQSLTPDAGFLFADRVVAFDHEQKCCFLLCLAYPGHECSAIEWFDETTARLTRLTAPEPSQEIDCAPGAQLTLRHERSSYLDLIGDCLAEIRAGESYEVCLTNMASVDLQIDALDTYLRLRRISPVPFGAFLRIRGTTVMSASPERFLCVKGNGTVESKPIKGTRPRGRDSSEDKEFREALRSSEKDRAENLMIVDLVRNDLNRVCEPGSVHAPALFNIETYAPVHQLVSTVRGKLRADSSTVDCVRAMFPGGSMTGAPKIRTMEIIDRLEGGARGVYSGALGWFGLSGASDLSIVIRTIVAHGGMVTFGIGGAVVALSDAADEFGETLVKARAMLAALKSDAIEWSTPI